VSAESRGRVVGHVGVEEVRPEEDGTGPPAEPRSGRLRDGIRSPLRQLVVDPGRLLHRVVVEVEATAEAETTGEGEAADEGGGGQAAGPQRAGQGRQRTEREASVASHTMGRGEETGE